MEKAESGREKERESERESEREMESGFASLQGGHTIHVPAITTRAARYFLKAD